MKMCDECYQLFRENFSSNKCPIYKCFGTLVEIDTEIANHISYLNKELRMASIPIRTNYTCIGHNMNYLSFPYIGFRILDDDTEETYGSNVKLIFDGLNEHFFKIPLDILNLKLKDVFEVIKNPYVVEFSPYKTPVQTIYRIFVNDFCVGNIEHKDYHSLWFMRKFNDLQYFFKEFLFDLVGNIKNIPNELRNIV